MTHELLALDIEKVIAFCFPFKVDSRLETLSMLIELLDIFIDAPVLTVNVSALTVTLGALKAVALTVPAKVA